MFIADEFKYEHPVENAQYADNHGHKKANTDGDQEAWLHICNHLIQWYNFPRKQTLEKLPDMGDLHLSDIAPLVILLAQELAE